MTELKPLKHGRQKYYRDKCRCDKCVRSWDNFNLKRNAKKKETRAAIKARKLDAAPILALMYEQVDKHSSLGRKMRYWRANGVDPYTADKVCCELGYHPFEVFGDAWWRGAFDE